jgi:hypothetical protein
MLEVQVRNRWRPFCLTIALLAAAAALSSCASQPKQTALVADPDAQSGSAIPWNKPATWEGRENVPAGIGEDGSFGGGGR